MSSDSSPIGSLQPPAQRVGPFEPLSISKAKAKLEAMGITQKEWAERNGFHYRLVNKVLNNTPKNRCLHGRSRKIAERLGLERLNAGELLGD